MAKKKRRKRRRRGLGLVVLELVLAIVILVIILGALAYFLCPLKKVTVSGTELYSDQEITEYILDDKYCTNTIYAYLYNKIFPKKDAEFIDHFDVKITGLNSLSITAKEKTILGYMVGDDASYIYFNYDGIITEISTSYVDGYMLVEGVTCDQPKIGDRLSIGEDEVGYLTSLIKLLTKENLLPNVISYDENKHITLGYDTYKISLGSSEYLEEKIKRVSLILPQIEGMSGTLHLENYSSNDTDIVFEKDENGD